MRSRMRRMSMLTATSFRTLFRPFALRRYDVFRAWLPAFLALTFFGFACTDTGEEGESGDITQAAGSQYDAPTRQHILPWCSQAKLSGAAIPEAKRLKAFCLLIEEAISNSVIDASESASIGTAYTTYQGKAAPPTLAMRIALRTFLEHTRPQTDNRADRTTNLDGYTHRDGLARTENNKLVSVRSELESRYRTAEVDCVVDPTSNPGLMADAAGEFLMEYTYSCKVPALFDGKLETTLDSPAFFNPDKVAELADHPEWSAWATAAYAPFSYNDVAQGGAGDCYFLGTIASMASARPELIVNAISINDQGRLAVTFATGSVDIEFSLPIKRRCALGLCGEENLLYAIPRTEESRVSDLTGGGELWPALLEKAYAKLKGGYEKIGHGGYSRDVMQVFVGQFEKWQEYRTELRPQQKSDEELAKLSTSLYWRIHDALQDKDDCGNTRVGKPVMTSFTLLWDWYQNNPNRLATIPAQAEYDARDLVPGHLYRMIANSAVGLTDESKRAVTLFNPWGTKDPARSWSDYVKFYDEISFYAPQGLLAEWNCRDKGDGAGHSYWGHDENTKKLFCASSCIKK
jgi:hypothetical protein